MKRPGFRTLLFPLLLAIAGAACAQGFTDKMITYWLPFPPGGESDIAARYQQKVFAKLYGKEMIVQYKTGAGGGLAWAQLNSMPGDGSAVMGVNLPHIVLQPLEGNVQYKTEDLVPVYWFHYTADAIVVPETSPFKTIQDLIKAARDKPDSITFAGSGTNSANHMAAARFDTSFGVKTTYVPFKGTGDLVTSLLGGHVSAAMTYVPLAIQQKGRARMLAVASEKRHPQFPDVPTFRELGIDWVDGAYRGIGVPKSASPAVQRAVSDMFDQINRDAEMRRQMTEAGFEIVDIGLDKVPAFMKERTAAYIPLARRMGLIK